jgi:hypothetical protein
MKNNFLTEARKISGIVFNYLKNHVMELLNPETPSYKTSMTVVPFFGVLALAAGDRTSLFWISISCLLFFSIIAFAQYRFARNKRNAYSSSDSRQNKF